MKNMFELNQNMVKRFEAAMPIVSSLYDRFGVMWMISLCMDGRVSTNIFDAPLGYLQPMRTAGGHLEMGWTNVADYVDDWAEHAYRLHLKAGFLIAYHFSGSDTHHGCGAFNSDTEAAKNSTLRFKDELLVCFDKMVKSIVIGIDTDCDGVIVHGEEGILDMRTVPTNSTEADLFNMLDKILPNKHPKIKAALAYLLAGNLRRMAYLRTNPRHESEKVHGEYVLCYGDGFSWVDLGHRAFKVGVWDPNPEKYLYIGAKFIKENVEQGRVTEPKGVLMSSKGYFRAERKKWAEYQSKHQLEVAMEYLNKEFPGWDFLEPIAVTTYMPTQRIEGCS